jgi:hypothetical protein
MNYRTKPSCASEGDEVSILFLIIPELSLKSKEVGELILTVFIQSPVNHSLILITGDSCPANEYRQRVISLFVNSIPWSFSQ